MQTTTHPCTNYKRHNKAWELSKHVISNTTSRLVTLMNARTHNGLPQDNIVPAWAATM